MGAKKKKRGKEERARVSEKRDIIHPQTMALVADELKAKAEVYYDDEICQQCTRLLLKEAGLPNGLLPLKDIMECGYVEETG